MKNKSTLLLIIGIAVILVGAVFAYNKLGALYTPENYLPSGTTESDKPKIDAPDFAVYDMDGNSVLLSEIGKGKKVVLNFWATWCKYCKEEMPDFDEVYKEMGDDVVFMMINLPYTRGESVEKAKEYIAENGFSFPVYFDNDRMYIRITTFQVCLQPTSSIRTALSSAILRAGCRRMPS